jgi:hypothetical protein
MANTKPELKDLLPGRVEVGEPPGGTRRRFTVLGALAAALALGSQLFDHFRLGGDWGFKVAMAIAGVIAIAIAAPWRFMTDEKTPSDLSNWKIGGNLEGEIPSGEESQESKKDAS